MGVRQDLVMYRAAINQRYPISMEMKQKMLEEVMGVIEDPLASKREKLGAAKVLLAAEGQNQADEKHSGNADAILAIADRLGVRAEVEDSAKIEAGRDSDGSAERQ